MMDTASPIEAASGGVTDAEDPAALLATADGLRDQREWIDAAVAYAAYLRLKPDDWAIWVQYGHCMKESGDAKAALLLYREAERLQPEDADLHLQVGHALKLLGRIEEAYQEYAIALTLDPESAAARSELLTTPAGGGPPVAPPASALPMTPVPPAMAHAATGAYALAPGLPGVPPAEAPAPVAPSAAPPGAAVAAPPAEPALPEPAPPAMAVPEAAPPDLAPPEPAPPAMAEPEPGPAPAAAPEPEIGDAPAAATTGPLVFDISDLLDYFRGNRAPTGIQRVQLNLIGAALDQAPDATLVVFDPTASAWKPLPAETFRHLARLSRTGASVEDPAWAGAVAGALAALLRTAPLAFAPGSRLVNLGTSWWLPDYLRRVRAAKAEAGLRYIPLLHDCIPLLVPEHCAAALVDEFARWFAGVALTADQVLCNSASTEADFRRLRARLLPEGAPEIPTAVLRLDATGGPSAAAPVPATLAEPLPQPLRNGRPYVLFVGTIESRKNHLMVFNAWLALLRRHGAGAVPDLVCVGKRGWLAEPALALHANSAALQEKVHLLHGIPDTALEALYRGCLFTLANSFYEGWGLPVTESLSHGKVPLVPDHSGFRESGAGVAVTFQPQNEPELVAQLERLAFDPAFRAAQEARIAAEVRLRSWSELAEAMLAATAAEAVEARPPGLATSTGPLLGVIHPVALLPGPEPSLAMAVADALREGAAWSVLEPWGCWTLPGTARLRVPLPPEAEAGDGPIRLHLDLVGPPRPQRVGLRAMAGPGQPPSPYRMVELGAGESLVAVLEVVPAEGAVAVEIDCQAGVQPGAEDVRLVGVGVRRIMACRPDDLGARLGWLERMALPRMLRIPA